MDELLTEFLTESSENIAALDQDMVTLEQNPDNPDLLSRIFRTMHTIKGTCGFIGLPRLEHVAHAGENVLGRIRDGAIPVTPAVVTLILECFDQIKMILAALEATEKEPDGDDADLIARLEAAAEGQLASAPSASAANPNREASPPEFTGSKEVTIAEATVSENEVASAVSTHDGQDTPQASESFHETAPKP